MDDGKKLLAPGLGLMLLPLFFSVSAAAQSGAEFVYRSVSPSVYVVYTLGSDSSAQGSAVVVGEGILATNCHVLQGASVVAVKHREALVRASLLKADTGNDLCLLRAPEVRARPIPLRTTDSVAPGQKVFAVGAPKGFELTISEGIVSAVRNSEGVEVIQTTAAISPGSSGGGLFDEQGRLVGITTFKWRGGENLNFAMPAQLVQRLVGVRASTSAVASQQTAPGTGSPQARPEAAIASGVSKSYTADEITLRATLMGLFVKWPLPREEIQAVLSAFLARRPQSAYARLLLAGQNPQDVQRMKELCGALSREQPNSPFSLVCEARVLHRIGDYRRAIELCERVVDIDPRLSMAYSCIANAKGALRLYADAIKFQQQAINLDPTYALARAELAHFMVNSRDYQGAYDAALQASRLLSSPHPRVLNLLGAAELGLKRYEQAISTLTRAQAISPQDQDILGNLGHGYRFLGKPELAVGFLEEALLVNPRFAFALSELVILNSQSFSDRDKAQVYLARLNEIDSARADNLRRQFGLQ